MFPFRGLFAGSADLPLWLRFDHPGVSVVIVKERSSLLHGRH